MRFAFQIIGMLGAVLAGIGGNVITGDNADKARWGYLFLAVGVLFGTGGFASLTYLFVRDFRAKLNATIRGAQLLVEEINPGNFQWQLLVEMVVTPPDGRAVFFNSDNIKARVCGLSAFSFPLEFSNLGISPSTNPRIADGTYAELTIAREMGVVCDGVTGLTMPPGTLTLPKKLEYDLELMDVSGDWLTVVGSDLYLVREGEYAGFPDLEKPLPPRTEIVLVRRAVFGLLALFVGAVLALL